VVAMKGTRRSGPRGDCKCLRGSSDAVLAAATKGQARALQATSCGTTRSIRVTAVAVSVGKVRTGALFGVSTLPSTRHNSSVTIQRLPVWSFGSGVKQSLYPPNDSKFKPAHRWSMLGSIVETALDVMIWDKSTCIIYADNILE
jgi:hypothetical protein